MSFIRVIVSSWLPRKKFTAMTVLPFIFIRRENQYKYTEKVERHEYTHAMQQLECLILGILIALMLFCFDCRWYSLIPLGLFYEIYGLEFIIKLPMCHYDSTLAYLSISFEQEAYQNQGNPRWLDTRPAFYWRHFITTLA